MRALAIAVALAASATGCRRPPLVEPAAPSSPQVMLHGVRVRVFSGDQLSLLASANELTFHRATRAVAAEHVQLQLPRRRVVVEAPRMTGNLEAHTADFEGGVQLASATGFFARTERAHYDGASKTATGDQPVRLQSQRYEVAAERFAFDLAEDALTLEGAVNTELAGAAP